MKEEAKRVLRLRPAGERRAYMQGMIIGLKRGAELVANRSSREDAISDIKANIALTEHLLDEWG